MNEDRNPRPSRLVWVCLKCSAAIFCLSCSVLLAQDALHPPTRIVYRTASSVLSLPYDVAERHGLAKIGGTVILSDKWGIVVHDQTGAIWVDCIGSDEKYAPGDEVVVEGPVGPGAYTPQIGSPTIHRIGHGPLPVPKQVTFRQLSSGQEDVEYVSIEGTVRAMSLRGTIEGFGGITLSVAVPEGRVNVILSSQYRSIASGLIDARVRITGTALNFKNDNRQATGIVIAVSNIRQIKVIQPGPSNLFSASIVPIGDLMRYRSGTDYFHRVRIQGVLTYYEPGARLILQDGTQAIEVFSTESPSIQIGDRVEAAGFPAPDDTGPVLRDAGIRQLAHGTPLTPLPLSIQESLSSRYRFCVVSTEMHLLRVIEEPTRTILLLEQGKQITTAELESRITETPKSLIPGSEMRVSGINVLTGETGLSYGSSIHSKLLLRTLDDAVLIAPAPWWTARRLFTLALFLGVLALAIFLLLLNVQLKRWRIEAALRERERLARDIHDTLAQSFAGIGFQLQVIRRSVAAKDPNSLHHVDVARKLVQFSHREARKSLTLASPDGFNNSNLLSSLDLCAKRLAENAEIKIEANSSERARPLSGKLNEQLFRIGQEAIANAIRHADPTCLIIYVDYRNDSVGLTVRDNGRGFKMSGDLLGFGIRTMRKRASEIGGELNITSSPGQGTCVSITVPVVNRNRFLSLFVARQTFLRNVPENKTYARH